MALYCQLFFTQIGELPFSRDSGFGLNLQIGAAGHFAHEDDYRLT